MVLIRPAQARRVTAFLAISLAGIPLAAQGRRTVNGNTIASSDLPAVVLEVDPALSYLGVQEFVLYSVANAEQHFFAELDGKRVKRFVWIQFEGYLPGIAHQYDYSEYPVMEIDGRPFHHNNAFRQIPATESRPDSDGGRARAFLRERGYTLGPDVLMQRLVWLVDSPPRHELMVIYMEDLADHGLTAADLAPSGPKAERWEALREELRMRAARVVRYKN